MILFLLKKDYIFSAKRLYLQRPDSNPDLLHSHGHNGQNFQYEKQSEIMRVSHGQNGQDFQCKNVSRRQKHSHGHNGQDFECEKQ